MSKFMKACGEMSKFMKAIIIRGDTARVEYDRPLPKLRDDYVLVRTVAVALNPTDWKHVSLSVAADGCLSGCDYSGVVEEIGCAVTKAWKVGDRICGVAHGGNSLQIEDGAFAEYIVVKGDIQIRIPDSITFQQAATIGLGAATVGQGLYQQALRLPLPFKWNSPEQKPYILIFGGSTATGSLAIQYAKMSGYDVFTTCSPKNFEYVKSLGAIDAFDYSDSGSIRELQRALKVSELLFAWDTIGTVESAQYCMDALSEGPGAKYGCISFPPITISRKEVSNVGTLMYSIFGEPFEKKGIKFTANSEDFEFAKNFMAITERLLESGRLKPHTELVGENGLQGVLDGLRLLEDRKVSGKKLVYLVKDTP